jgi:hypothetical protein
MLSGEFMTEVNVPYRSEILWWTKNDSSDALLPVERKDRRGNFTTFPPDSSTTSTFNYSDEFCAN